MPSTLLAADLPRSTEAMTGMDSTHRFLPLWIEPAKVAQTRAGIEQDKTRSAEEHFRAAQSRQLRGAEEARSGKEKAESRPAYVQERATP